MASLVHHNTYREPGMGKESVTFSKRFALLGLLVAFVWSALPQYGMGATVSTRSLTGTKSKTRKVSEAPRVRKRLTRVARSRARTVNVSATARRHRRRYYEHFTASSFVDDSFDSDVTTGEDPVVREALGVD